jgi:hypothetical protein
MVARNELVHPAMGDVDDLASKLRSSGAAAIVIAPKWPQRPRFAQLSELASETIEMPLIYDLFSPQQQLGRGG